MPHTVLLDAANGWVPAPGSGAYDSGEDQNVTNYSKKLLKVTNNGAQSVLDCASGPKC